jgi:hypothetical protein
MNRTLLAAMLALAFAMPVWAGEAGVSSNPEADLARSLGNPSRRWNGVYTPTVSTGAVTVNVEDIAVKAEVATKADAAAMEAALAGKATNAQLLSEVAIRQQMDNDLQEAINAEATARQDGDGALQGKIDGLNSALQGMANKPARLPANSFSFDVFSADSETLEAQQEELTDYAVATLNLSGAGSIPNFIAVHNLNGNHLFIFNHGYLPEDADYLGTFSAAAAIADIEDAVAGSWAFVTATVTRWNYDGEAWTDSGADPTVPSGWVDNGIDSVQLATQATAGVVQFATDDEMAEGTATDRVASVAQIKSLAARNIFVKAHTITGDGQKTEWAIAHGHNTRKILVQTFRADTGQQVIMSVAVTDANTVTLSTSAPLAAGFQIAVNLLGQTN